MEVKMSNRGTKALETVLGKDRKKCLCYITTGKCSSPHAPNPGHSWCIGTARCVVYPTGTRYEKD